MNEVDSGGYRPDLEPTTQQFVDTVQGTQPLHTRPPQDARAAFAHAQAIPVGKPGATIADMVFPTGPTGAVRIRTVRPRDAKGSLPVIMHFHGGGWVFGDANTHDRLARELAVGVGAALIFVEYDLSPEVRYPVAIEQAYAAMQYVVQHGQSLDVDPTRLAVLGDGVGGTIAAAVTLMAKERRGPKIDFQVLFYPATSARCDTQSYTVFAEGLWLTRAAMQGFWDAYLPDIAKREEIGASPLNASLEQLRNLPEALIIVAESDVVRDEGEAYARKLSDAGVRVTAMRYIGTIHDFAVLNALADTPAARGAISQVICALKSALH